MTSSERINVMICIIVPAALAPIARELCAVIATGESGVGMLLSGASPDGSLPPTHFVSQGHILEPFAKMCGAKRWERDADGNWESESVYEPDIEAALRAASEAGFAADETQIRAILDASDISIGQWEPAFERLQLMLCNKEELL